MSRPTRMTEGAYDLGHGQFLRPFGNDLLWSHPECQSWHRVDVSSGKAHRISAGGIDDLERLTIEGSLQCPIGVGHGFIRDGSWVPA